MRRAAPDRTCSREPFRWELVVSADYLGGRTHHIPLGLAQEWVPNIENQNGAGHVRSVPGFMLDGIVEPPRLSAHHLAGSSANPKAAVGWNDQRQVHRETGIRHAGMRR